MRHLTGYDLAMIIGGVAVVAIGLKALWTWLLRQAREREAKAHRLTDDDILPPPAL